MTKTLTSNAATEAAKLTGAGLTYILEVQWGGATGTKYYSGSDLASPVTAEGRVLEWGQLRLDGTPGQVGGHAELQLVLSDNDLAIMALMHTEPGVQGKSVFCWLYFTGTTWPTDRVKLFEGRITAPIEWTEEKVAWQITARAIEEKFSKPVGELYRRAIFNDVACEDCEGEIIPIVYGDPVKRVPACLIGRPGDSWLAQDLFQHDATLTIAHNHIDRGFTDGTYIELIVGSGGNAEVVGGTFEAASSDQTQSVFDITFRGSIQASGNSPGLYGLGGAKYLLISKSDISEPEVSRGGYFIWVKPSGSSEWLGAYFISDWRDVGASIAVLRESDGVSFGENAAWKISAAPGTIALWRAGSPVNENDDWTYAVNFLPSKEITKIEAKGTAGSANDEEQKIEYREYNTEYYTVNLNDKTHNTALGRDAADPGITTITMSRPPHTAGFNDKRVYATVRGITDDNTETGTVLTNPADIIENLLENAFIGNVGSRADATSFAAAKAATTVEFAFALLEERDLNDLCGDLAFQAGLSFFWDAGSAYLKTLGTTLGTAAKTITESDYKLKSLSLSEHPVKDGNVPTELIGVFRASVVDPDIRFVRKSAEAIAYYGRHKREVSLWAFQDGAHVSDMLAFWLSYWLHFLHAAKLTTWLDKGLVLQPGDVVTLNIANGQGDQVFSSQKTVVRSVDAALPNAILGQMPEFVLMLDFKKFDFAITAESYVAEDCAESKPSVSPVRGLMNGADVAAGFPNRKDRTGVAPGQNVDPIGEPESDNSPASPSSPPEPPQDYSPPDGTSSSSPAQQSSSSSSASPSSNSSDGYPDSSPSSPKSAESPGSESSASSESSPSSASKESSSSSASVASSPSVASSASVPGSPSVAGTPGTPSVPASPSSPSSPVTPSSPPSPSIPAILSSPASPSPTSDSDGLPTPSSPGSPSTAASPSSPLSPSSPSSPTSSSLSGTPATPSIPASPSVPGSPKIPASPKINASAAKAASPNSPAKAASPNSPHVDNTPSSPSSPASP